MLFNSLDFAVFFLVVFILYWFVADRNLIIQNSLLLVASYIFYGWWDWRFLSLIVISSGVDYLVGIELSKTKSHNKRKLLLTISLIVNIGLLGFFKYFNFFTESFVNAFTLLGYSFRITQLKIILPVGISFYTFQTLSYTIDVYRKKITATRNIIAFFAFVSFFPQLVAGPIERAANLLPQFKHKRIFNFYEAADGMRQILWGLFKKVVIADNAAVYVNDIFSNYTEYSGSTLFIGGVFFAFQIYGDFSGYSDIAIGTARLLGFKLMRNFAFPYFSRDIAEFWRRWHISLSTWFRDYLYIPMGGSRVNKWRQTLNIFVVFIVSGFWHGANWTFLLWGALNAVYILPLVLLKYNRKHTNQVAENTLFPNFKELIQMVVTFFITIIAWILFRANDLNEALHYLKIIFSKSLLKIPEIHPKFMLILITVLIIVEWFQRDKQHALQLNHKGNTRIIRWFAYLTIIFVIIVFGGTQQEFIYFQF